MAKVLSRAVESAARVASSPNEATYNNEMKKYIKKIRYIITLLKKKKKKNFKKVTVSGLP
jgi:hypothetical protein